MNENYLIAAGFGFLWPFFLWSVYLIAGELEMPFGSSLNDLPLQREHHDFNYALITLMDKQLVDLPKYNYSLPEIKAGANNFIKKEMTGSIFHSGDHLANILPLGRKSKTSTDETAKPLIPDATHKAAAKPPATVAASPPAPAP